MRPTVQPTVLKNWVIYEKTSKEVFLICRLCTCISPLHKIQLFFINHPVSGVNYHCNRTSKFWYPHWKVCIFLLQIKLSSKKTFLFCTYNTCIALGIFANYDFILCKAIDIILWIVCHAAFVNGYFIYYVLIMFLSQCLLFFDIAKLVVAIHSLQNTWNFAKGIFQVTSSNVCRH